PVGCVRGDSRRGGGAVFAGASIPSFGTERGGTPWRRRDSNWCRRSRDGGWATPSERRVDDVDGVRRVIVTRSPIQRVQHHAEIRGRLYDGARRKFPDHQQPGGWDPRQTGSAAVDAAFGE